MRFALAAAALALTACGQPEPPPLPEPPQTVASAPWFICDALNAPVLLVFGAETNGVTEVAQYEKPSGAIVQRTTYTLGASEGAAGSSYRALLQNGAEVGHVREVNAGVLENPGSAYTPVYSSVRLGERELSCRWMPRTRFMGFTGRRTIVVSEDADGDLLYHSYDFANAAEAQQIDVSENGRTSTFSAEVRGGTEEATPNGVTFTFTSGQFAYLVESRADRTAELNVSGMRAPQREQFVTYVLGDATTE